MLQMSLLQKCHQHIWNQTTQSPIIVNSTHKILETLRSSVVSLYHLNISITLKISYINYTQPPLVSRVPWHNLPYACPIFYLKFPPMIMLRPPCMMIPSCPRSIYFQQEMTIRFLSTSLCCMIRSFCYSLTTTKSSIQINSGLLQPSDIKITPPLENQVNIYQWCQFLSQSHFPIFGYTQLKLLPKLKKPNILPSSDLSCH